MKAEVRQMYYSLLQYVGSDDFEPESNLDKRLLQKLLN